MLNSHCVYILKNIYTVSVDKQVSAISEYLDVHRDAVLVNKIKFNRDCASRPEYPFVL